MAAAASADPDGKKDTYLRIYTSFTVEGTGSYIPAGAGTYIDPPEAFAEEFPFSEEVEEELSVEGIKKSGNTVVISFFALDEDELFPPMPGMMEWDGSASKLQKLLTMIGVNGTEEVYGVWGTSKIKIDLKNGQDDFKLTPESNMYFTADMNVNVTAPKEYLEKKSEEIAAEIEPPERDDDPLGGDDIED